jgi:hypothetical protein
MEQDWHPQWDFDKCDLYKNDFALMINTFPVFSPVKISSFHSSNQAKQMIPTREYRILEQRSDIAGDDIKKDFYQPLNGAFSHQFAILRIRPNPVILDRREPAE